MTKAKCAAAAFGFAVGLGAIIGAACLFTAMLVEQRSLPSAGSDAESWLGALGLSLVAAIGGSIAGAVIGAVASLVAALLLGLIRGRTRSLPVRVTAVGVGAAVGAVLVLWFIASRPGVLMSAGLVAVLATVAAGLAVAALLVGEHIHGRSML